MTQSRLHPSHPWDVSFHHFSHLWVASTRHHESESILIDYPFRALNSRPRVDFHLWPRVVSFPFRARSSWPRSFTPSWPRVILSIYSPELMNQSRSSYLESFILFPTQSRSSYFQPKVVHLVHDLELFISSMTLSHHFHLFFILVLLITYLSLFTIIPLRRVVPFLSSQTHVPILLSSCARTKSLVIL